MARLRREPAQPAGGARELDGERGLLGAAEIDAGAVGLPRLGQDRTRRFWYAVCWAKDAQMTPLEKWAREVYGKAAAKRARCGKALFPDLFGHRDSPLHSPPEPRRRSAFPGSSVHARDPATMYRGRFWTMASTPASAPREQTNERFHYL